VSRAAFGGDRSDFASCSSRLPTRSRSPSSYQEISTERRLRLVYLPTHGYHRADGSAGVVPSTLGACTYVRWPHPVGLALLLQRPVGRPAHDRGRRPPLVLSAPGSFLAGIAPGHRSPQPAPSSSGLFSERRRLGTFAFRGPGSAPILTDAPWSRRAWSAPPRSRGALADLVSWGLMGAFRLGPPAA